ncbi:MAG: CoA transferase, partial [Rhizobiales bacterium]|nr:CoA transferase [Hyphomicrobiales bacterium]
RILSGPYASMILADLGAEIIKIEPIEKGDETRSFPPFQGPLSHYFIALNRNKKSVCLDLKSPEGLAIARQLSQQCDIVLENFRPGVMDRLGLGYDALKADNPSMIYCSITGFGKNSPHGNKPAFDIVAQALSGVMSVNCEPGQSPNKMGLPIGDLAGSIFSLFGILAALHERNTTGHGRHVEVAMLDSLIAMQGYLSQLYFITGQSPKPVGTRHPSIVPYGSYPTKDGHVIVACLTERFWHNFARCLEMEDLITDPRFAAYEKRLANSAQLEPMLQARMLQNTTKYWLERLTVFDVPNAPILSVGEALDQEHVAAHQLIETVNHLEVGDMRLVRGPILFDGEGPGPSSAPPLLGENTKEVLANELGYSDAAVAKLKSKNVIG